MRFFRVVYLMVSLVALGCIQLSLGGVLSHAAAPAYPDPELCQIAPRSASAVTTLERQPPPAPSVVTWEGARDATSAENTEVERTLIEFAACFNASKMLHVAALMNDRAVIAQYVDLSDPAHLRGAPPVELRMAYLDTFAIYRFADGRIGALYAVYSAADATPLDALYILLAQHGDRWLIDEIPTAGYVASGHE